jgi:Cu/Ag efflux protein CusF
MHRLIATVCLLAAAALPLAAAAQHGHGSMSMNGSMNMNPAVASANAPMSEAVVRGVDQKAGEITIAHGPIAQLGMPKMTMTYRVKNPASLTGIKAGSTIRFAAENVNGELVIVALEPVK